MNIRICKLLLLPLVVLGGCNVAPSSHSSRLDGVPLNFAAQPAQVDAQAEALIALSNRIVVQSTVKGAALGAVVGCGLAVASAGSASNCLVAASVGGVSGAVAGHLAGKRQVARKIEKVSPSAIVRTLRKTNAQLALVQTSLPARLAVQEETLANLEMLRATGTMDRAAYLTAREDIAAERRAIAAALLETEKNARQAKANLQSAQSQGQTGLAWHISATGDLAHEASSARSSISLL